MALAVLIISDFTDEDGDASVRIELRCAPSIPTEDGTPDSPIKTDKATLAQMATWGAYTYVGNMLTGEPEGDG